MLLHLQFGELSCDTPLVCASTDRLNERQHQQEQRLFTNMHHSVQQPCFHVCLYLYIESSYILRHTCVQAHEHG